MSLDKHSVIVRWARHYHWGASRGQTVCGLDVPGGAIKRDAAFGLTVAGSTAMCTKCEEMSECSMAM